MNRPMAWLRRGKINPDGHGGDTRTNGRRSTSDTIKGMGITSLIERNKSQYSDSALATIDRQHMFG
jgi:hypothetical protein